MQLTYPKEYEKSVQRITSAVHTDSETAYAMMLMTATLMDLRPGDDQVVDMILKDCGVEPCKA